MHHLKETPASIKWKTYVMRATYDICSIRVFVSGRDSIFYVLFYFILFFYGGKFSMCSTVWLSSVQWKWIKRPKKCAHSRESSVEHFRDAFMRHNNINTVCGVVVINRTFSVLAFDLVSAFGIQLVLKRLSFACAFYKSMILDENARFSMPCQ